MFIYFFWSLLCSVIVASLMKSAPERFMRPFPLSWEEIRRLSKGFMHSLYSLALLPKALLKVLADLY